MKRESNNPLSTKEWDALKANVSASARLGQTLLNYKPALYRPPSKDRGMADCAYGYRLSQPVDEVERLMRSLGLAVGFMLRDAESYLQRNLEVVMALGEAFARYWLFFVENDSVDGTKGIMRRYMRRYPTLLRGDMFDGLTPKESTGLCRKGERNCFQRIRLMAGLRQRVLDMALAQEGWDVFLMLDIDFIQFIPADYLQMVSLGWRLNAAAIFGQSHYRNAKKICWPYDRNAWRPIWQRNAMNEIPATVAIQECMGVVQSGHGGFSTLFASALRESGARYASYSSRRGWQLNESEYCVPAHVHKEFGCNDLVPLNMQLYRWGQTTGRPLLADPRFRPLFLWGGRPWDGGKSPPPPPPRRASPPPPPRRRVIRLSLIHI